MALVAYYYLKLHQMDTKIAFLNGDIDVIYKRCIQRSLSLKSQSTLYVIKLNMSIYDIKEAFCQQYRKFDQMLTSFGFKENIIDQ